VYSLVVGDVLLIESGTKIPADCVLIEGNDLIMDESFYNEGKPRHVKKSVAVENTMYLKPDPFILT
jgi:P-type Ca2+ transporter type 2C